MKPFAYHLAASPADAVATLTAHPGAAYLAGGWFAAHEIPADLSYTAEHEWVQSGDDAVTLAATVNGASIALGTGTNTLVLASGANTLATSGIATITGSSGSDALTLTNAQNGTSIALGGGTDTLTLADGAGRRRRCRASVRHLSGGPPPDLGRRRSHAPRR